MIHHVHDEFLRELGHIVVSFSVLEDTIQFFLMALIQESQRVGRALTTEMPFRNLRAGIVSVFLEKHGKGADFDRVKSLINLAGACEEERNRIIHSDWTCGEVDNATHVFRSKETAKEKHGLRHNSQDYTPSDLRRFGDSLLNLAADFEDLLEELCGRQMAVDTRETVVYDSAGDDKTG
jgi:hypothetical protein